MITCLDVGSKPTISTKKRIMDLSQGTMRPGRVIEVLENGCIKVEAPGLFSEVDKETLPKVMPFFTGTNSFSSLKVDDDVWVLNFDDNPLQLYWFRKDPVDLNGLNTKNLEILCRRKTNTGWASIYFNDGSGWVINKDNSKVQIRKDGSIMLDSGSPYGKIDVTDGISLGREGKSSHPASLGDEVQKCLEEIISALEIIRQSSNMSAYTKPIGVALQGIPEKLKKISAGVCSVNVTLE